MGTIILSTGNRDYKGNSIIAFPSQYCVIDIETTGLSPKWDQIIELGAVRYLNGVETNSFHSLVQPDCYPGEPFISDFISELTGITNDMLATAPKMEYVLRSFIEFLGQDILVGHNVSFDVNFIYDNCVKYLAYPFQNDFVDTMRIARKVIPGMSHYRLRDIVEHYGIANEHEHRALYDVRATAQCYQLLYRDVMSNWDNVDEFLDLFKKKKKPRIRLEDLVADENATPDPDNPLYGKHCCFTGALERFTRAAAAQIVINIGGIIDKGVTKKTNYLVLGNNDYCTTIKDGKSSKQKKAEQYKLAGQDITIMPEDVFYDIIAAGEEG